MANQVIKIKKYIHPFERILSIFAEDIVLEFKEFPHLPWDDFLLNPRRLRGSDFLMRWSQGVWSEHRLTQSINEQTKFYAIPYGPSSAAPHNNVREFELYFERLEEAGLGKIKRPDLLIFNKSDKDVVDRIVKSYGGIEELPFLKEDSMKELISKALVGIECENSLWVSQKMPDFQSKFTPQRRLGGKLGLKKIAVLPTIIIKEEDRLPLKEWQIRNNKPIHVWHVFYDKAYGIALDEAERLFNKGLIEPTIQVFQAPGGATTRKAIYKIYYQYAYNLGTAIEQPELKSAYIEDKNGHILPYVVFSGGKLEVDQEAIKVLNDFNK